MTINAFVKLWLIWLAVGLAIGVQDLSVRRVVYDSGESWWLPVAVQVFCYQFWWILTPLVLWIGRRFPLEKGAWRSLGAHGTASLAVPSLFLTLCQIFVFSWARPHPPPTLGREFFLSIVGNVHTEFMTYWIIVGVQYGVRAYRERKDREVWQAQAEARLMEARLIALKMQLEPHFLFNTLNAISELIHEDPDAADEMTVRLGDFLRLTLESASRHEIRLQEEVEFLRRYLAIEEVRFADRLSVSVRVDPDVQDALVPALLLQPLVENAIRHGIARSPDRGAIDVRAARDEARGLRITIENTGPETPVSVPKGIGLANVAERLEQLYGARQDFRIASRAGGGAVVEVSIPLRVRPEPAMSAV